jgi:hypothetical protein
MEETNTPPHRLTWLASIVCIVMVIPGTLIGGVVKAIYYSILSTILSAAHQSWYPDFIQSIYKVIDSLALQYFPSLLQGLIGGAIAMAVTIKFFKDSNHELVFYATAFSWSVLAIFIWTSLTAMKGIPEDSISFISQTIGLVVGLNIFRTSMN